MRGFIDRGIPPRCEISNQSVSEKEFVLPQLERKSCVLLKSRNWSSTRDASRYSGGSWNVGNFKCPPPLWQRR